MALLEVAQPAISLPQISEEKRTHMMPEPVLVAADVNVYYGNFHAIKNVSINIMPRQVTALIGPSGCGKSTFLRSINRMNDLIEGAKVLGSIKVNGEEITSPNTDVVSLRKHIGMVFQRPNPFPMSIFDNIAYGPRIHGTRKKAELLQIVERSLKQAALWDEVKDKLHQSAMALSGGQQQRLCIARTLAVEPSILLMDEPASALDPTATFRIEELMQELKQKYTIIIVTHNMQQAARCSETTGFFFRGELLEFGETPKMFTNPDRAETDDYIRGRFG